MTIPRTFWRVWLEEPVPPRYEPFWDSFKDHHRGWQFRTVGHIDQLGGMPLALREVFNACTTHAGRSDVARYWILYQHGGIYVDCDVECLRSFEELVHGEEPFAGWEDDRLLCPTVMGAPPKHMAMADLLGDLPDWFERRAELPPNQSTGPYFLTAAWRWREDVRLLPPMAFYPVHWSNKKALGGPYPSVSFAVHHWDANWLPNGPPQRD